MRKVDGAIRLSASDLMRFKGCRHAAALDLRHIELADIKPATDDDEAQLLQEQGDLHEVAFLEHLKSQGRVVVEIPKDVPLGRSVQLTHQALKEGPDIIFQGAFLSGAWGGYSDFLERVEKPSDIGAWSYEVVDTKLKRKPDPKHVLQLSLYSDLLSDMQGMVPDNAHLELGDNSRFTVRLAEVSAYARHGRRKLEQFLSERPSTRSEPSPACKICRWRDHCDEEWNASDSLALVAGVSRSQRRKLEAAGVTTMGTLAEFPDRIPRLAPATQDRIRTQARLQTARRDGGPPSFQLRELEPGRGFGLMPEPDEGDVFYDIEGDPYFPGGLEYLHGFWFRVDGEWTFRAFWAHDKAAERNAVQSLLSFLIEHLTRFPKSHVYHYANYEMAALRRLTAEHRVGEAAIDQLQRERRFVDLFKVVSGGLVASEKGYSIKDLEAFYRDKRSGDVATAGASVVFYERWRKSHDSGLLDEILDYNRTDCISTQQLRDWLVDAVRPVDLAWPVLREAASFSPISKVEAEDAEIELLRKRLEPVRHRLGDDVAELLLDLSGFHKREDKPAWWAIFDKLAQESETLLDDLECIQGLEAVGLAVQVTPKSFERTYRFPEQETKLRAGKLPCVKPSPMPEDVDLRRIDHESRTLTLRRSSAKGALPDALDLLPPKPIANATLRTAVISVIEEIIRDTGQMRAIEHLVAGVRPTFINGPRPSGIVDTAADLTSEITQAIAAMDRTTLAIQGPPGTGKTYVSAVAIVDLVRAGKRIAVSSNSHKAISNLLSAVADRARVEGVECRVVQKGAMDEDGGDVAGITVVSDNDAPEIAVGHVVGATAWHFARYKSVAYDYLLVDEAGQVSLANILAMARAATNIVLVGDPMQLPQPIQGTHPGRSSESSLQYLIGEDRVIPRDRGIFMPVSRRMHPLVCGYISEAVYQGQLRSDAGAAGQSLMLADGASAVGASMVPVVHFGRSQVSPEEIAAISAQINRFLGSLYSDRNGRERTIGHGDILVVAPYNAQVNALREALPRAVRVGTVDRFQGQEAPICLVSMTTSSGDELPRDIDFLFSLNRINVAVSRAQVVAMVFASPMLLETPCRSVPEMSLVNAFCRLREYGQMQTEVLYRDTDQY